MSCPGDVSQACGGDGTYISIYYDQKKYTPGPDSIPAGSNLSPDSPSGPVSSTKSSISSSSTSSSSQISSIHDTTLSTATMTTSTSTISTSTSTASMITSTASAIQGFTSLGCFSDPSGGKFQAHNMPKLFSNNSMTPELCISSALARLSATPATTYAFVGLEYGRECYAHTAAPSPQPSSLVGSKACNMKCKGDSSQKCGGANMYNLYGAATVDGVAASQWTSAMVTATVGV